MKIKELFFIIALIALTAGSLFASEKEDKLTGLFDDLSKSSDKNKAGIYNQISKEFIDSLPQLSISYADSAILFATQFQDKKNILVSNYNKGKAHYQLNNFEPSIDNFLLALKDEEFAEDEVFIGDLYAALATSYNSLGNHDLAIKYYRDGLTHYEQTTNKTAIIQTYYYLASSYHDKGDYALSLQTYFIGIKLLDEIEDCKIEPDLYNGLGVLYFDMGSYEKALDYYSESYQLYEKAGHLKGVSKTMNNIGIVYYDWGNIEKALEYYQKSLQIEKSLNSESGMAGLYNNMGIIYHDWGQYDISIDYYEKSLALYEKFNDLMGSSYALNNLGETYTELEQYDKALDFLFRSLQVELDIGTPKGVAMSYESISRAYLKMGNVKKALQYVDLCKNIADSLNQAQLKMVCKEQHYKILKETKSFEKALKYYEEYQALKDSIYNNRFQEKITDLQVSFEYDQKQMDLEKQKLNNQILQKERRIQRSYLLIIFILLIVFGILIFYDIKSKSIANKKLNKSNDLLKAEKEKLSSAIAENLQNEEKYKSLIKLYHSGILYLDKEGEIIEINDKMLNILGLRSDKPYDDINCFKYPPILDMGLADDLLKCKNSGETVYNETHFINKWGKGVFLKYFLTPVPDHNNAVSSIIANVEDVTATLEAAKLRHESEQKHRMLVENSLQAMLIIQDGKIIFANKRMEELSKYTFEELSAKGRRWIEALIHPEDIKRSMENVRKALSGKTVSPTNVYKIIRKDGKERIMETKSTVVDYKGKPAMLVVAIDDTCRKSAEIKIKESEKKLLKANAMKDRFFSIIAHDLKNPFNSIVGFANLLNEAYDNFTDKQRKEFIQNICDVSENTYKLLQNLLEWSQTQTDNIEFNPRRIDIGKIIDEIISLLKSGLNSKNINVTIKVPSDTTVYADENMVKVIIRNLLTNAIKFSHENGSIFISSRPEKDHILFSIRDEGIGISKENLDMIFRIDKHFKTKGTNNEQGSGLGLILCKEFVEKNHGSIFVESTKGEGSNFLFTLPSQKG
jgi:PAS domain S-box-containing protein